MYMYTQTVQVRRRVMFPLNYILLNINCRGYINIVNLYLIEVYLEISKFPRLVVIKLF